MTSLHWAHAVRATRDTLQACCLVVLVFASPTVAQETVAGAAPQAAPEVEMKNPRVSFADVNWHAARTALVGLDQLSGTADAATHDALARLNWATESIFPKIAVSPVPVLLPFDTAAYLRDAAQSAIGATSKYLSGFQNATFFFAGPSGYDAILSLRPKDVGGLDLSFANRVDVLISGSVLLYQLDAPALAEESPVPQLASDFPDIRRVLLEERLRYTFTRFGVPYIVSIMCFDGPSSTRRLSCREADKIAVRVVKTLNIAGGSPQTAKAPAAAQTTERPEGISPDFTFYAPGDLLPGTGMKGQGGRADATVYSKIRFPMAQAPDFVNSQSFMNWGDCNFTGRVGLPGDGKTVAYRCRVNSIARVQDESKNYAYPWRDNFCEHRDYYVGQCPAGLGHQGQDIRPGSCLLRNEGADRCAPYQHDLVAVRDGVVMRNPGDEALYLVVDQPGEHIRFRYLHMDPQMLDAAGMINGRQLSEAEVIGAVDNYGRHQGGTSYHLHFNVQVLTRDGWVFVNPYMTLVASYERLIGGRGQVVRDAVVTTASLNPSSPDGQASAIAAATDVPPNAIVAPQQNESAGEHKAVSAEPCKTRIVKGHHRRLCVADRSERRERGRHAVRSVDRRVSR
jgi:hypothetical protein